MNGAPFYNSSYISKWMGELIEPFSYENVADMKSRH